MARGLFVHTSTRLEDLFGELAAIVANHALPPLQNEVIAVPSQGIARWLRLQLAAHSGIAAGLELPFLGTFFSRLLRRDGAPDPLAKDMLVFRLWRVLRDPASVGEFGPAADYCRDDRDDTKCLQLCQRLARVFDDYQVYRPELLAQWSEGRDTRGLEPHVAWQSRLWRRLLADVAGAAPRDTSRDTARGKRAPAGRLLFDAATPAPATAGLIRVDELRRVLADPATMPVLPQRLSVFGAGTVPPAFLDLLELCARHVPVHLFVPAPALLREGDDSNVWIDAFGRQARELANVLADLGDRAHASIDTSEAPSSAPVAPRTLLECLQHEISRLDGQPLPPPRPDDSFRVHDCHSVQREMEVVRDQILAAFDSDVTLQPHDVFVLVPDIERYAPIARAVFGPVADHLPFHVADRTPASELPICSTLFALLQLAESRFEVHDVFRVLEEPAVHRRFELFAGDLPLLRERCDRAGIRWGIDGESRARTCRIPEFDDHAWQPGIERLLFGIATGPIDELVLGVLPAADATSSRDETLARFLLFVRTLFTLLPPLARPQTLPAWADRLDELIAAMFAPATTDDALAVERLRAATAKLREAHASTGLVATLAPAAMRDWLETTLQESGGARGFLAGAVTVAALLPMRTVPARRLYVCGLDDASFPRTSRPLPFDLVAQQRRLGDRDPRLDDRQLFLDVLLAARESLHLTFVGHSQKDDSPCAPSVLLAELLDLVERTFGAEVRRACTLAHPLQPWSVRYRGGTDEHLFTFSRARLPDTTATVDAPPWCTAPVAPPPELAGGDVPLALLLAFWKHPCRFFLKEVLRVQTHEDDDATATTEPFALDSLDKWRVQNDIVRRAELAGAADAAARLAYSRAAGRLPMFGHGEALFTELDDEAQRFLARCRQHSPRRRVDVRVELGGTTIHGAVDGVAADVLLVERMANTKPKDRLRGFVLHAVLALARHRGTAGLPDATLVVGKDDEIVRFREMDERSAAAALELLLRGYREGCSAPLPFFPATSFEYGDLAGSRESKLAAARSEWKPRSNPDFAGASESEDAANALCFRGREALELDAFAVWADGVWQLVGEWTVPS